MCYYNNKRNKIHSLQLREIEDFVVMCCLVQTCLSTVRANGSPLKGNLYFFCSYLHVHYIFAHSYSFFFSLPKRNSDPGSVSSRLLSPFPATARAFTYIAIRLLQPFLGTLAGWHRIAPTHAARRFSAVDCVCCLFCNKRKSPTHVGFELQDQPFY